jgi:hypothetical protein
MVRSVSKFWWVALLVAWAIDLLFWQKAPGISFLIWIVIAVAGLVALAWSEGCKSSRWGIILVVAALAGASITFIRAEPLTRFVNGAMAVCLFLLLTATFKSGYWIYFRVVDYIKAACLLIVASFSRLVELASAKSVQQEEQPQDKKKFGQKVWPILRGLLLTVPIVGVLAGLLASADPIFADALKRIFDLEHFGEYIFRTFYVLIMSYLIGGIYLHAVAPRHEEARPDTQKPWLPAFLGWTEATVVLVGVNLLFLSFVLIQFRYFFGGAANISETGYTFSEYARRGFGELVAVSILSLLLYLSLAAVTRKEQTYQKRLFTVLSVILMSLVLVILVSAFQRLLLYEDAYGFTRLRTYPHVFMVWLGVLLAAAILFELIQRRGFISLALLFACAGYCLTLAGINVDGLIASQNIERARKGGDFDTLYLRELSEDAVPVLLDAFDRDDLSEELHNEIGGNLACRYAMLDNGAIPWQELHLGKMKARQLLLERYEDFSQYPVTDNGYDLVVEVNGVEESCSIYSGFN